MGQLRVGVLGQPAVLHGETPVRLSTKATAAVCYLAVVGERRSRAELAGLLWGEMPGDRARANLRMVLSELRRAMGGHLFVSGAGVGPGADWRVDLSELRAAFMLGGPQAVARARSLARDDLLVGLDVPGAPEFDRWLLDEREHVRREVVDGLLALARTARDDDPEQALALARDVLARDPIDEAAHRLVMDLLATTGRRAAALAQFERCRRCLAEELGVDPSPETVALRDRLLHEDAAADRQRAAMNGAPRPGGGASAEGEADGGAGGSPVVWPRRRLPPSPGPLVGREDELERLRALLTEGTCRLVTLVGPGGVGKTRLAVAAAGRLAGAFADGVVFVPLDSLAVGDSEAAVAGALARALDLPPWRGSPLDAVRRALQARAVLVVLDNIEHVHVADVVGDLLDAVPRVAFLATSRRRIGLGAEWLLEIGGLAYPKRVDGSLERHAAVALFTARAQRVRPDFTPADDPDSVLRICQAVGGLPLALELAADWLRALDPAEVARLVASDLDALATEHDLVEPRQRRMRAVLEASWRLLDERQRRVLARLAVFRGGFDAEAARAVADASPSDLAGLVDRSVVQSRGSRFDLHELLRQFAEEHLDADPEGAQDARTRHATYIALVASEFIDGVDDRAAARLDADLANLRAAADWLVMHGTEDELAACVACLWHLAVRRSRFAEALGLLEMVLARPGLSAERAATWRRWAGTAAYQLGRMERASAELEASFASAGQPLPQHHAALVAAILRESARQCLHRLLRRRPTATTGDGQVATIEAFSLLGNTMYFLQRPLPMLLYALLEANAADLGDDAGAASCAYAELGHVLLTRGWRRSGGRYGRLSDTYAAQARPSELLTTGFEARILSHLAVGDWNAVDAQIGAAVATVEAARLRHRHIALQALVGAADLLRGQFGTARATFEAVLAAARAVGDDLLFAWAASGVTDATLGLGGGLAAVGPLQAEAVERSRDQAPPERLKSLALLAALRLAEGDRVGALALARIASSVLGEIRFIPAWTLDAYGHVAHVWLALRDEGGTPRPERAHGARSACRHLERFARLYPVGRPRAAWAAGWLARLDGHPQRARAAWRRSLAAAERLGMPYDAARAHAALADLPGPDADDHRAHALALLDALGSRPALLELHPSDVSLTPG